MDNKLLEYSTEELLIAALRKNIILKLASVGSPIDQERVDSIATLVAFGEGEKGLFIDFAKALDACVQKYWEKDGGTSHE